MDDTAEVRVDERSVKRPGRTGPMVGRGAVAGAIGALLMILVGAFTGWMRSHLALSPLDYMGARILHAPVSESLGPGYAVLGFLVHLGIGTALGIVFGLLAEGLLRGAIPVFLTAVVYSMLVLVLMNALVVPLALPEFREVMMPWELFLTHVFYAIGLCAIVPLRQLSIASRRRQLGIADHGHAQPLPMAH